MTELQICVQRQIDNVGRLRYSATAPGRCTGAWGSTDCSGNICIGYNAAKGTSICMSSFQFATWIHQANTSLPKERALATYGAVAIKGPNEGQGPSQQANGADGHIATLLGKQDSQGRWLMVEARGHAYGVCISVFRDEFSYFGELPNLAGYGDPPPPQPGPQEGPVLGEIVGNIVPGSHMQTHGAYDGRWPFVAAVNQPDGTTDLCGENGGTIDHPKAVSFLGMSVLHLGHLTAPMFAVSPEGNALVFMAQDGGTFAVKTKVHYT